MGLEGEGREAVGDGRPDAGAEGDEPDVTAGRKVGKGFDIRGREYKRALGRKSKADSPTVYSIAQYQETLVRARKNEVGQAFLKLVLDNPNAALWEVHKGGWGDYKPAFDEKRKEVVYKRDPLSRLGDNVVAVKRDGKEYFIVVHDENNLIARAMKNIGPDNANVVIRALAAYNRYLAAINTSLNPEFVLSNFVKDLQTALVNLAGERELGKRVHPATMSKRILADIPRALQGAFNGLYDREPGDRWRQWFDEYKAAGGMINFYSLHDIEGLRSTVKHMIDATKDDKLQIQKKVFLAIGKHISNLNGTVENATRLAVYVNGRKAGLSQDQAASLARNITVNFTRKGEFGNVGNALYLFYNAGIQGTTRILYAAKSPAVRKIIAGIAIVGFGLAVLNRLIAGQDDDGESRWDQVPDYVKSRNMVFMRPGGGYWKIPMAWGYNVPFVLGTNLEFAIHNPKKSMQAALGTVGAAFDSFNPLGGAESHDPFRWIVKNIAPTIVDPWLELALNEDWAGRKIRREQPDYGPPLPASQLYLGNTSFPLREATAELNRLTGGNEIVPGWADFNPANLDYLLGYFSGGVAQSVVRALGLPGQLASGDEIKATDIPIARRFIGDAPKGATYDRYTEIKNEVQVAEKRLKALGSNASTRSDAAGFRDENRDALVLAPLVKSAEG